jgi:hypothetical protein
MEMDLEAAFEVAISDGINHFLWKVLHPRGFLVADKINDIARGEVLELKNLLARDQAKLWAAMPRKVILVLPK